VSSVKDGVVAVSNYAAIDPILRGQCLRWPQNASIDDIQWIYVEILAASLPKNNNRMQDEA